MSHEGQRYFCDICPYNATTKDIVKRHKKKKHPESDANITQLVHTTVNTQLLSTATNASVNTAIVKFWPFQYYLRLVYDKYYGIIQNFNR